LEFNCTKNALAGESGCGKSTILQLLMRFYDPDEGRITIDGVDLKFIDLEWLRTVVGYVGQEPPLFATSIRRNLQFAKEDATDEEIYDALKKAEAYDFVQSL
jgi:ATP-binding cassette subfamily B (MDR/TAP) protein 1